MAKIAAVINNFNYANFVGQSIQSALDQTVQPDEIIVVDDGSTDNSLQVIGEFKNKIRLITKPNAGQLSCFFEALDASGADYFFLLDADDTWTPDHIESGIRAFRAENNPDCVFANCELFGNHSGEHPLNKVDCEVFLKQSRQLTLSGLLFVGMPTSACAFKRYALEDVLSRFHDTMAVFKTCGDEVLVYGTSLLGYSKFFTGKSTTLYRTHGTNLFFNSRRSPSTRIRCNERRDLILKKLHLESITDSSAIVDLLQEYTNNSNTRLYKMFYKRSLRHLEVSRIRYEIGKLHFTLRSFKISLPLA